MNKQLIDSKIESLTNALIYYGIPDKYFIKSGDKRQGHRFTIASKGENGALHSHCNFMTYEEMNCYLFGYAKAIQKPLL